MFRPYIMYRLVSFVGSQVRALPEHKRTGPAVFAQGGGFLRKICHATQYTPIICLDSQGPMGGL